MGPVFIGLHQSKTGHEFVFAANVFYYTNARLTPDPANNLIEQCTTVRRPATS